MKPAIKYLLPAKLTLIVATLFIVVAPSYAEIGVTASTIRLGGVMDLEGKSRGLGQGMRTGILAAIGSATIDGHSIKYLTLNDSYTPSKTVKATQQFIQRGVFAMVGNVGTPTAKVSLPILAQNGVPAIGFFTGSGILRPGVGDVVNFRASYAQEIQYVIGAALKRGVHPQEVCAYVQNDAYGMAGIQGMIRALSEYQNTDKIVSMLSNIIAQTGEPPKRNGMGPVGVYTRNTFEVRDGYMSLKAWEESQKGHCKLVVTVGTYNAIAQFAGYSRYKGDQWPISAVSFTGASNFQRALSDLRIDDGVVMTQAVPPLSSALPIVQEARSALGDDFGYVTLEGFIVGKMVLQGLKNIDGEITRRGFLDAVLGHRMYVGGMVLDFTTDNQGSDLVVPTILKDGKFEVLQEADWGKLLGSADQ